MMNSENVDFNKTIENNEKRKAIVNSAQSVNDPELLELNKVLGGSVIIFFCTSVGFSKN